MAVSFHKCCVVGELCLYCAAESAYFFCASHADCISLTESWTVSGIYVFASPSEPSAFADKLSIFWEQYQPALRILWIKDPDLESHRWQCHGIFTTPEGMCTRQWGMTFSGYSFLFPKRMQMSCTGDELLCSSAPSIYASGLKLSGREKARLGFGDTPDRPAGQLRFAAEAPASGSNLFLSLDAGIYYVTPAAPDDPEAASFGGAEVVYSPVLDWREPLSLSCGLNPIKLLDPSVSFLGLPAGKECESSFLDAAGHRQALLTTDDSRLVFQETVQYLYGTPPAVHARFYLGLAGRFRLAGRAGISRLLCGFYGTEYMHCPPGTVLNFIPGSAAYLLDCQLNTSCTASWCAFSQPALYCSQPHTAPLFSQQSDGMLFQPAALCKMTEKTGAVPMLPYGCLERIFRDTGLQQALEDQLLENRHRILTKKMETYLRAHDSAPVTAISPQGLLVGMASGEPLAAWEWIALAETELGSMRLVNPDACLRARFQQAELFTIYDNPKQFLQHASSLENFLLETDGWRFLLHPSVWRTNEEAPTLFVIKFNTRHSLAELLKDNAVFAASLHQAFDAFDCPKEAYKEFLRVISDSGFQGILILNCPVEMGDVQPELRLLVETMDTDEPLWAHHVLLYKSHVSTDGGIRIMPAAFDGLITQNDASALTYSRDDTGPDAAYRTLSFSLRFQNNVLAAADSVSELLLNRLFAASCIKKNGDGGNCLILDGRLCTDENGSHYEYRLRKPERFCLQGGVLEQVACSSAALSCDENGARFVLDGSLAFSRGEECDIFSYGMEADGSDQSLGFQGLKLTRTPQGEMLPISCESLRLLPEHRGRKNSMAARFPMKLLGFTPDNGAESPAAWDYLAMQTPMAQAKLGRPWFALHWSVMFGPLGDISTSSASALELLFAWSPPNEKDEAGCWLGAHLPGGSLEIQGLLRLGFQSADLQVFPDSAEEDLLHYELWLNRFSLKALSFEFPPGRADLRLASDPAGEKLGWCAAYLDLPENEVTDDGIY